MWLAMDIVYDTHTNYICTVRDTIYAQFVTHLYACIGVYVAGNGCSLRHTHERTSGRHQLRPVILSRTQVARFFYFFLSTIFLWHQYSYICVHAHAHMNALMMHVERRDLNIHPHI